MIHIIQYQNNVCKSESCHLHQNVGIDLSTAKRHLCGCYTHGRFKGESDEWPPYHPKHYTTLALIHHKGRHTDAEVIAISQELASKVVIGNAQFSDESPLFTKDISEFLTPEIRCSNPRFILIEGAPGIGKTVLSKEIVYQWANNNLLKSKMLVFLLFLRDPNLKKIRFIENLIQHVFKTESVSTLSKHLFATEGKDLTIIFDGYDEMAEEDRNDTFVADLISRRVLPKCDLVVTSRPTASVHLRDIADCRVEVLGFTEENRLNYIEHALQGSDDKIKALQSYLQSNHTINTLCYIPLNMTILLTLFADFLESKDTHNSIEVDVDQNLGSLPNSQTELSEKFILMTITRFLRKKQLLYSPIRTLSNLPEPHNMVFVELCKLAYEALSLDKIVFEFDEIKNICPNLTLTSDSWSGLGLLKAVQFVNTVSFHFLHFSIQEYLAAYHIASLSNNAQIKLLKTTFWNFRYFNTWVMYVGITGGENFAWRHFVSGNRWKLSTKIFKTSKISKKLSRNKVKCLHLFQCYLEVGGNISVGRGQTIDLSYQTLLLNEINALGFFLLKSKDLPWKKLDLSNCNIRDNGCNSLHQKFYNNSHMVHIEKVDFSYNQLDIPSILLLIDMLQCWRTSEAFINEDYFENDKSLFKSVSIKLSASLSKEPLIIFAGPYLFAYKANAKNIINYLRYLEQIKHLYLNNCVWNADEIFFLSSTRKARYKFQLSDLHIIGNDIVHFMKNGVELYIQKQANNLFLCDQTLSNKYLDIYADLLQWKPHGCKWLLIGCDQILCMYSIQGEHLSALQLLNCICTIKTNSAILSINYYNRLEYLFYENKSILQDIIQMCLIKIKRNICFVYNRTLIANNLNSFGKFFSSCKYLRSVYICKCPNLSEYTVCDLINQLKLLSALYIVDCHLFTPQSISTICSRCVDAGLHLKELFIHTNNPLCSLTSEVLAQLSSLNTISAAIVTKDTFACQRPTNEQISLALQLEITTVWKFHNCHLSAEAFYCIAYVRTK